MNKQGWPAYKLFDDPLKYYNAMLDDIAKAKSYVYLETYRFNNDSIGIKFKDALTKKSRKGVHVKLLMDSWGTSLPKQFFDELLGNGADVRFFQRLRWGWDFFTQNHKRNHRKLIIIDDRIAYIGSANLTDYSLNWRESILRIETNLAVTLKNVFLKHFELHNKLLIEKGIQIRKIILEDWEIVRDIPSITRQRILRRYLELIRNAKHQVVIETPYFLPSRYLRKAMIDAVGRGVIVKAIMPKNSDVGLVDLLRNRYLGPLHKAGVELCFYLPHNLHAKILLIDEKITSLGSPNFDYRSFRFQHEIILIGENPMVIEQVKSHIAETVKYTEPFDYDAWEKRSALQRFFEKLVIPFRHLL